MSTFSENKLESRIPYPAIELIKKGSRGGAVSDIQRRLLKLGYGLGPSGVDGVFSEVTEQAVKNFQKDWNLFVDGVVGEETWRKLVEATYVIGDRVLYIKAPFFHGDDVRTLQKWLSTLGFSPGPIDGVFGPATERAAREFQKNVGLSSDGIVGTSTLEAFHNLKNILEVNAEVKHPREKGIESALISVFEGKKVVLFPSGALEKPKGEMKEVERDIVLRLGNLLELLGGEALHLETEAYDSSKPAEIIKGKNPDLGVGFYLEEAKKPKKEKVDLSFSTPKTFLEKGQRIASFLRQEIVSSLGLGKGGLKEEKSKSVFQTTVPFVFIKLFYPRKRQEELFVEESFRQKVAVALFDGLKRYFES